MFLFNRIVITKAERTDYMTIALKEDYQRALGACNGRIGADKRGKDERL